MTPESTEAPAIVAQATDPPAIVPSDPEPAPDDDGGGLPLELLIGGAVLLLVLIYVGIFLRGQAAVDRYAGGFVIDRCPVCEQGRLEVDTRTERLLGIPRARHTVRCDNCRSVLRETEPHQWRYAVDPMANDAMYKRYNGEVLSERDLSRLQDDPLKPRPGGG
jgi:hypothetical protein